MFLIMMIAGLFGLLLMAVPGMNRHGHSSAGTPAHTGGAIAGAHGTTLTHGTAHAGAHAPAPAQGANAAHPAQGANASGAKGGASGTDWMVRLAQPRVWFGLLALYGAFGYLLTEWRLFPFWPAALAAVLPALLLERYAVTPLWNALLGFQGKPCSPLETLVMSEATAVTPFRNGKGIVTVERDGRAVQLTAQLPPDQAAMPVRVGDRLRVEDVDAAKERVTVSLH